MNNDIKETKNNWFHKNFKKITFALALTAAVSATIGLIVASVRVNKTDGLNYYLERDYTAVWSKGTIWQTKNASFDFVLYISPNKKLKSDIKWDGKYLENYFRK